MKRSGQVVIADGPEQVAEIAADICCELVTAHPRATLGLATGGTPMALYRELVRRYRAGAPSFAGVTTFNLDEYVGLGGDHPRSYRRYMDDHLFGHVDIGKGRIHLPDGLADPAREAQAYERRIAEAGGIDLQILGIGRNGHIGFNEPGSSLASRTRITELTPDTVHANARFFAAGERQPAFAITMGIGTILEARRILLIATGSAKAPAVRAAVEGPVSEEVPASALQLHSDVTVLVDRSAAAGLNRHAGHRYAKPREKDIQPGAAHG